MFYSIDLFYKGYVDISLPEDERRLDNKEITWLNQLDGTGRVKNKISRNLFLNGDSRKCRSCRIFRAQLAL